MTPRVAIVAALPEEVAPLLQLLSARQVGRQTWSAGSVRVTCTGVARAADWDARGPDADVIIGMGVAGALSPGLTTGDVVVAANVLGAARPDPAWTALAAAHGARAASIVTVARLATGVREKQDLHARQGGGVAVVDLESALWAAQAERACVPWIVVRAVADTADDELPAFLADCVTAAAGVRRTQVLAHALLSPRSVPTLLRLRRKVQKGAERLAEVVGAVLRATEAAGPERR